MQRRQFLASSLATTLAATFTTWLLDEQAAEGPTAPPQGLREAYERATASGRPLLVLVIPDEDARSQPGINPGYEVGRTLNHAEDDLLAHMALAELACASTAELQPLAPGVMLLDRPAAVLVDPLSADEPVTVIDLGIEPGQPPRPFELIREEGCTYSEANARVESAVRERMDAVAASLQAALAGDEAALTERAARNLAALGEETWQAVDQSLRAGTSVAHARLLAAAPLLHLAVRRDPSLQASHLTPLVEAVRATWIANPPPGAHWARSSGCGTTIEGVKSRGGYACGMGHVPELSRRFLYFYADRHG